MIAAATPDDDGMSKQARYSRRKTGEAADIGPIRAVVNPERKEACRLDLRLFLVTYFPQTTGLRPLSVHHDKAIARIQDVILNGGRKGQALPRGFAKTTIGENSSIWAIGYGHRSFVSLFGATDKAAGDSMDSIKMELETNDLIDDDFPEITQAIRALEGKPQRCKSQTCEGEPTFIQWTAEKIALPVIKGSPASGAVVTSHGITAGSIRGMRHKRPDGKQQRPDFALVDDPQTDESALTPQQVKKRMGILRKVILRLSGHRKTIACIVNGTIIEADDLMDILTDHKRSPDFQSDRLKMMEAMATAHDTFWLGPYAEARTDYDPDIVGDQQRAHAKATDLYVQNREMADAGADAAWEWCFDEETELSAIQHAYNILVDDGPEVFASECQNQPLRRDLDGVRPLNKDAICAKLNNIPRGIVPVECTRLTAFVDVQKTLLYYAVCGWFEDFGGAVIDFGTFPDQGRSNFVLAEAKKTLQLEFPEHDEQGAIYAGLNVLTSYLCGREWERHGGGGVMHIEKCGVDTGYEAGLVYQLGRQSKHAGMIQPTKGYGIGASTSPMRDWGLKPQAGERRERLSARWVIRRVENRAISLCSVDTNAWKDFVVARLAAPIGSAGCLSFFGDKPSAHELLAAHLTSEYGVITYGKGRQVTEWKPLPKKPDNHWLDCIVGCAAMASVCGSSIDAMRGPVASRKRVPLAQMGKG